MEEEEIKEEMKEQNQYDALEYENAKKNDIDLLEYKNVHGDSIRVRSNSSGKDSVFSKSIFSNNSRSPSRYCANPYPIMNASFERFLERS